MLPTYWLKFIKAHKLIGKTACLSEDQDLSKLGADMQILTQEQSIDELTNFWPGIGVAKDGYVPVAMCSIGSGDYYYINTNDGPNGSLYRVYHDSVGPQGYNANDAIAKVLNQYEEILKYIEF